MKTTSAMRLFDIPCEPTFFSSLMNFFKVCLHLLIKIGVAILAILSLISLMLFYASDCYKSNPVYIYGSYSPFAVYVLIDCSKAKGSWHLHNSNMLLKQYRLRVTLAPVAVVKGIYEAKLPPIV